MFADIPREIKERMSYLEEIDRQDRLDGTERIKRLRQIPLETGHLLAILAANAPSETILEIGTSAAYSTMWLYLAALETGKKIITFETLAEKAKLAQQTIDETCMSPVVRLIHGDARDHIGNYRNIAFCFLDAEKEVYLDCYNLIILNLVEGGLLAADNVISHKNDLSEFVQNARNDVRVDVSLIPIGKGVLICRKV